MISPQSSARQQSRFLAPSSHSQARANLESADRNASHHDEKLAQTVALFHSYPAREHGLARPAATWIALLLWFVDLPAMWITAEATRVESVLSIALLTCAATTVNSLMGWEIGALMRVQREPEPPTPFHVWMCRAVLTLTTAWLSLIFLIRANVWSPYGLNPIVLAGFLTLFAVAVIGFSASLAYRMESARVGEARAEMAHHKRESQWIQHAQTIYAHDLRTAAATLDVEGPELPSIESAGAPKQLGSLTNGSVEGRR